MITLIVSQLPGTSQPTYYYHPLADHNILVMLLSQIIYGSPSNLFLYALYQLYVFCGSPRIRILNVLPQIRLGDIISTTFSTFYLLVAFLTSGYHNSAVV